MFIHSVYFWLRPDLTDDQHAQFQAGVQSLTTIDSVQHAYVGVPAPTDRPVIERGYSTSLIVIFADQVAHDAYQIDAIHDQFRAQCGEFWHTVVIYDTVT